MSLEEVYNFYGIKEFIYFVSSPQLQEMLLPAKLVFIVFTLFFFTAVVYFMLNSSWVQYKFLEDTVEFFSWRSYGSKQIEKKWNKIKSRIESGFESEFKLAIIEAEDFLNDVLEERGYEGGDFQERLKIAEKTTTLNLSQILSAHETRNSIVYNPDFKIDSQGAKKILDIYREAINNIGLE